MTTPTYELRLYADPQAFPFGTTTLSRHRTAEAARNAWRYEERRFRASPYGNGRAWLPRVIVKCCAGAEAVVPTTTVKATR